MTINQLVLDSPDEEPETTIDPYDPARWRKWGYTSEETAIVFPDLPRPTEEAMHLNAVVLTTYRWRQLPPKLRAELRQALGSKQAIIGRQVLDLARDLCARSAYGLALALYEALQGDPPPEYQGCGLGLLMDLCGFMGEDPAPATCLES